jgi:hypothetical protein
MRPTTSTTISAPPHGPTLQAPSLFAHPRPKPSPGSSVFGFARQMPHAARSCVHHQPRPRIQHPRHPQYSPYMLHPNISVGRQYRARALTICLLGVKTPPLLDLLIPASYCLNLHINVIPGTPSTCTTPHFQWARDIDHVHSVSALLGQNPHPHLISVSRPPTTSTRVSTSSCMLPLHAPPSIFDEQEILRAYPQ